MRVSGRIEEAWHRDGEQREDAGGDDNRVAGFLVRDDAQEGGTEEEDKDARGDNIGGTLVLVEAQHIWFAKVNVVRG